MKTYFMGIDTGGTMTKAAIFDNSGKEISVAAVQTPVAEPQEGFQERNMLALWEATCTAISRAITSSGLHAGAIKAVGCTGHGKGLYLWGKDDQPAYNAIASTDHRGALYAERWKQDGTAQRVREKTLQNILDCHPVTLLAWLRDHHPEVLENTRWIFEAKDYIRFMLTGEAFAELTDYSGTCLLNLHTKEFDRNLLALMGLEQWYECLPPLKNSYDLCGKVTRTAAQKTGLAEGTPVCGGMFDIDACAVAMDVSRREQLCVITGTWSINEYISSTPITPDSTTLNSLFCIPGYYLIEESSPTSAGNLEWAINTFLTKEKSEYRANGRSIYHYVNELVAETKPEDTHVMFVPFLYGSNASYPNGAFLGLKSTHGKKELLTAVFEGVAFSHMVHIERLLMRRKAPKSIRIAGGVVYSEVWLQIFADVIGISLEVVTAKELGALGCAMAAAVCSGEYEDYHAAARAMVRIGKVILPNAEKHAVYVKKYAAFKKAVEALGQCVPDWE